MRILVADDDPVSRNMVQAALNGAGYQVVETEDGLAALEVLRADDPPRLAVLDWMMPGMDGVKLCREIRLQHYAILLTSKGQKDDLIQGLESGADDYLTKPFDPRELVSRIRVGERILHLEHTLGEKVDELQMAMAHVKRLQGLIPICMHCKKIRDDGATWHGLEVYIEEHSEAMFTHCLCEECLAKHYPGPSRRHT